MPRSAAEIMMVKNGTPYQMLVMTQQSMAVFLPASHPTGSPIRPMRISISLNTPEVPLNIHRHIKAMTKPETAHGKNTRPWYRELPRNFFLRTSASPNPTRNWNARDTTTHINVFFMVP